ncbi:1-deoxy-D-xylulose-5-phosphate synthase N-terminal domain-containing protein, partial [Calditrichota bacterium]
MFKLPISDLQSKAHHLRRDLIDLLYQTGSGHLDTSLSLVEIWLALVHSDFFHLDPSNGSWEERDRIFLSEGHACPLQYLINADLGYYSKEEVFNGLRKPYTKFGGHTVRDLSAGLENSNGSLSIGLWQAYGMALDIKQQVFCIAGDGEFQEPSAMSLFSATHNLRPAPNYTVLLNYNHLAQDAAVDIGPLATVAEAYNWHVQTVNGH